MLVQRRNFDKLLGEVSLCWTLQVWYNPCWSVSSRTRHRSRFSRVMHRLREPREKKALGNETKRDRNSRVTCWSQYRFVMELQEQKLTISTSWGFPLRFLCFCNHRSYSKIISSLIGDSWLNLSKGISGRQEYRHYFQYIAIQSLLCP